MKHLFVPYELAVKLKEKGFDERCLAWYGPIKSEKKVFYWDVDNIFYRNSEAFYKEQGANLTNHSIGGEGQTGTKQSPESNLKRSLALKGRKLGPYSEERKKAISEGMKGRVAWNKGKTGQKYKKK